MQSIVKICQWDFLKVAALKHSVKKAMTSPLIGASSTKVSTSKLLKK